MSIAEIRFSRSSKRARDNSGLQAGPGEGVARQSSGRSSELGLKVLIGGAAAASLAFFASVVHISALDPGFFDRLLLSALKEQLDPVVTGSTAKPDDGNGMPVPTVVRERPLTPGDFQIVMVFGQEALLATTDELWRVKVGSVLPALGTVLAIEPARSGGTVRASNATLRAVAE